MLRAVSVCTYAADGSSPGRSFEASDLGRLPVLSAVIKESLRVCPPAPFGGSRICPTDNVDLCGHTIHKVCSSDVALSAWMCSAWQVQLEMLTVRLTLICADFA